jgi:Domain of unknown function (DUF151)
MTYQFAAALVGALGGRVRQVRIDRLVAGAYAATVEVEGLLGVQHVDARSSDALNLGALTTAPIYVSLEVAVDCERRQQGDSEAARLLRLALTSPPMTIGRERRKSHDQRLARRCQGAAAASGAAAGCWFMLIEFTYGGRSTHGGPARSVHRRHRR